NRITRRVAAGVVVEIGKHVEAFREAPAKPPGPLVEALVAVTAAVAGRTVMEANVDERSDNHTLCRRPLHIVQAQGNAVACEPLEYPVVVPARIAKLDPMSKS